MKLQAHYDRKTKTCTYAHPIRGGEMLPVPIIKLIVAGTRTFNNYELLKKELDKLIYSPNAEIVSGCAAGADTLGERYAKDRGITIKQFPADWDKHGKSAGAIRNKQMADYATHCIVFWNGQSKGTEMMIKLAAEKGLHTIVINYSITPPTKQK